MRTGSSLFVALVVLAAILSPAGCSSSRAAPGASSDDDAGIDSATLDATPDAREDVDNGSPSTSYPAPHPPLPLVVNNANGPVLTSPKIYLIFFPDYPYVAPLVDFAQKMATSAFWSAATQEYGVGALSYGGAIMLTEQAPAATTSAEIETWVAEHIAQGAFGTPDPQGIYSVFYPQETTITQPNPVSAIFPQAVSCMQFGGYHDNTSVALNGDAGAPTEFAYAVIPTCSTDVNISTAALSHEWVEASTDPFVTANGAFTLTGGPNAAYFSADKDHVIWDLAGGGEAGDLCEPEAPAVYVAPSDIGYMVQRTWSNLQAQSSHDPCAPDITGAFFDAAPVLTDTVSFTSFITGTITTQGVVIPAGQSQTIEVDLFSDGDTGGPWTVSADDLLYTSYGSYGLPETLSFAWDRTQGVNGEKLHLTITVMASTGALLGGGHAFNIISKSGSRVATWPGLVVEK